MIEPTSPIADLYVMNSNGSGISKLPGTSGGGEPAWSPDGTMVAFVRDGLWVMHADGTLAKQIRHDPAKVSEWPAWSPDGRQIAFVESPTCAPCSVDRPWVLNVINVDGSGLRKVADAYHDDRPAWLPDGQAIAFAGRWDNASYQEIGIQSVRLDGTGLHQMTYGFDAAPAWSSTGELAFMRNTADPTIPSWSLWVAGTDGSNPRPITLAFFAQGPVSWSPDGLWVALAAADYGPVTQIGMWDIWIIQPDGPGGMVLTKTTNRAETAPSWR